MVLLGNTIINFVGRLELLANLSVSNQINSNDDVVGVGLWVVLLYFWANITRRFLCIAKVVLRCCWVVDGDVVAKKKSKK